MARILLIDMDTLKRAKYHRALRRDGHVLGGACSGAAALEVIQESPMFDVIVVENISDMTPMDLMLRAAGIMGRRSGQPARFLSILEGFPTSGTKNASSSQLTPEVLRAEITRILQSRTR